VYVLKFKSKYWPGNSQSEITQMSQRKLGMIEEENLPHN
jgi:hypothetical protein